VVEEIGARGQIGWTVLPRIDGLARRCAIGSCDLSFISPEDGQAQTGFLFRRDQWGQGFALEAMQAVTAYAFGPLELTLLSPRPMLGTKPARRLLERLGFLLTGSKKAMRRPGHDR